MLVQDSTVEEVLVQEENSKQQGFGGPESEDPGNVGPGTNSLGSDGPGSVGPGTDGPGSVVIPSDLVLSRITENRTETTVFRKPTTEPTSDFRNRKEMRTDEKLPPKNR